MTMMINAKDVTKKVDHFTLGPVNLDIEPGTITALVGDNGSGKSTLFKMIMDLVNPTSGAITVFGQSTGGKEEEWKQHIAYLPQTPVGYDGFLGKDLHQLVSRWYPNWDERKFVEIVQAFQIPLQQKFGRMSQGEQQKLSFALTLPRNADLMILDEPTSFLDIPSKQMMMDFLVEWMETEDRSILFASHQAEDIQKLADYIVLLRKGKMLTSPIEKDSLLASYRKFWLAEPVPHTHIPGVMKRKDKELISNAPEQTETFLKEQQIDVLHDSGMNLEEIIALLLQP